jgi:hypothetical protein
MSYHPDLLLSQYKMRAAELHADADEYHLLAAARRRRRRLAVASTTANDAAGKHPTVRSQSTGTLAPCGSHAAVPGR